MKQARTVLIGVAAMVFLLTGVIIASGEVIAQIWGTDGAGITNDTLDQLRTSVSGDVVVFSQYDPDNTSDDVVGYDFATESFFDVSSMNRNESRPQVSGDVVVYVADQRPRPYTDVFAKDLVSGDTVNLSDVAGSSGYAITPAISGDFVVWEHTNNPTAILRVYHLPSGKEIGIPAATSVDAPDIWSDGDDFRIVWEDDSGADITLMYAEGSFDAETNSFGPVMTAALTDLFPAGSPAQAADMTLPSIWGDVVAWTDWTNESAAGGLDIKAFDMASDTLIDVAIADDHDVGPDVSRGWISWTHWFGDVEWGETPTSTDVYLYSVATGTSVRVTDSDTVKGGVVFDGNRLAWIDQSGEDKEVMATVLDGPVGRSAGLTRYTTAVMTSRLHFTRANTVVVATGEDYPDALAAASLAGAYECPVLLTKRDSMSSHTLAEIERLGATQIVLVGGHSVISQELEEALSGSYAVRRISGPNRYATSQAIAEEALGIWGTDGAGIWGTDGAGRTTGIWGTDGAGRDKIVFIARGDSFADALAVSPVAYSTGIPVLLTRSDTLSPETEAFITGQGSLEAIILGGEGAISGSVQTQVDALLDTNGGTPSTRWEGSSRYSTAADIAGEAIARGWVSLDRVGLATGRNFPDGLAGGPAIGVGDGVLLLVDPRGAAGQGTVAGSFIEDHANGVGRIEVFGGESVVADSLASSFATVWADSFATPSAGEDASYFSHAAFTEDPVFFEADAFFSDPGF